MAKIQLKKLLHEIHSRSVWQVLSVYVAGSWGVLQAVEMVQGATGLPEWILPAALVLLLIGLPVVLATAVIQGGPHLRDLTDPGHTDERRDPVAARRNAPAEESPGTYFTWRNTLVGGAGAGAILVLLMVGWFARDYLSAGADTGSPVEVDVSLATAAEPAGGVPAVGDSGGAEAASGETRPEMTEVDTTADDSEETPEPEPARRPPAPPPPAAAPTERVSATERAREGFRDARLTADSARQLAAELHAAETVPDLLGRADSLWNVGDAAGAAGRYEDAARLMDAAGARFAVAAEEARAVWRDRIGALEASLPDLAEAADPTDARFASAGARAREGARLAAADDLPGAASALSEAADLYREIPGAETETSSEADPAPPAPSPRDIVEATLTELSLALAAEDLERVRATWVSLSEEQAANLSTFFRRWDHIDVTFDPDWASMTADDGAIGVTVYTTWRFMENGEAQEQPPFEQTFRLMERETGWVVVAG